MLWVLLTVGAFALLGASTASAADRVYFSSPITNTIGFEGLDGSGGADLSTTGASLPSSPPEGVALDPAHGLIYWADYFDKISFARLDGSGGGGDLNTTGATVSHAGGVAIDPVAGKIYWANGGTVDNISYARLDGSGGGVLNTTGATYTGGYDVAVDPAAGLIYYSTYGGISFARLDGSGGGDLNTTASIGNPPSGVALDLADGMIYWSNYLGSTISFARLDGSGGRGDLNTTGARSYYDGIAGTDHPNGVAVDPAAGRVYWGSGAVGIAYANLDDSGGGTLYLTGTSANYSDAGFPVLLRAPTGTGVPVITGAGTVGAKLDCSEGAWAPDLVASFDYDAAQSFAYSWTRNLVAIPGGTTSSITAGPPGLYLCQVTASNYAGSTVQTSDAFTVNAPGSSSPPPVPPPTTPPVSPPSPVSPSPPGPGQPRAASRLRVSPATFTAAGSGPSVITPIPYLKPHHSTVGATVSYTLNAAATVRFIVQQRLPGREERLGNAARCVAPTHRNRRAHRCTRTETLRGFFTQAGIRGANRLRFSGRLNGHKLTPGSYTLLATPKARGKTGREIKVTFRIIH